jgi:alpha-glucoside transport system substrate-binding protein
MTLRIQLLGPPRISRDGRSVDLPGYRPLALLAYLVVTGQAHPRDHLVDLLFDRPDDPRAALRWTLSKLRQAIGADCILANRREVSFNFACDYWLDVSAFEAGKPEMFQGDFLEGLYLRDAFRFEEWLLFERERLRRQHQSGLEQRLVDEKRRGDCAAVVATAQQLLRLDNLREEWYCVLMEAYARLGERQAALVQFTRCRRALRTELDTDPAPKTVALAEAIQRGQIGPELPRPRKAKSIGQQEERAHAPLAPKQRTLPWPLFGAIGVMGLLTGLVIILSGFFDTTDSEAAPGPAQVEGVTAPVVVPDMTRPSRPEDSRQGGVSAVETVQQQPVPDELAGTTVTILGPRSVAGPSLFNESIKPFEERTGIDIVYIEVSNGFEDYIVTRVEEGTPPDIAQFPQPGLLVELTTRGKVVDVRKFLDDDYLRQQYSDTFLEMVTIDGKMAGVWYSVNLKSLVWYPKQAFEAAGYEVPKTWDEMIALSDRIVADGGTPWCISIESKAASGWVGTDWVEDILLRTASPQTYDAWVNHDLPFDSPEVRRAFEIMAQIWFNEDYVYGGRDNIQSEAFYENPLHLFEDPPGCYLHRQGSWLAADVFPKTAKYGQDYDFFYLPPIDPEFGKPVLGGGDIFAMFNDRPEVREVMRHLTTSESARAKVEHGGFISPHRDTPLEWYPSAADLRFAQIILNADTYRFDGSDLMPGEVGTGSFWRGITAWVAGADIDTVLQEIDGSWPQ